MTLTVQPANGCSGPPLPSQLDHPSSYLQLSDLRTGSKRKRASSLLSTIRPEQELALQMAPVADTRHFDASTCEPQDLCVDCVVDCDDADCQASSVEQCTDQCIVIPCKDTPCLDPAVCPAVCTQGDCRVENCDGGSECFNLSDESLQLLCCTDYHNYPVSSSGLNWNCTLDDILGVNGNQYGFPGSPHFLDSTDQIASLPSSQEVPEMPSDSSRLSSVLQDSSAPGSLTATPYQGHLSTATSPSLALQLTSNDFACRWLDCNASFGTLNELVGHVNLTHLRPPSTSPRPAKKICLDSTPQGVPPLSCRWDDCHVYPDASTLPGPSTGLQPDIVFDMLSSHFFHDHLGLSGPPPSRSLPVFQTDGPSNELREKTDGLFTQNSNGPMQLTEANAVLPHSNNASSGSTHTVHTIEPSYATPEPSPPPDSTLTLLSQPHDCTTSTHICLWRSCGQSFPTCAALTEHLAISHVGGGKGHYDCYWGECMRSGAQGFTSKQKIMRHLQAHTGHRPFACKECGQHFSEAATLQQHMRRHTQEKPFVCDFPGCGKAFAITGALTIHKRTHNGERPFQCPHCDRAFAESSNLSKHLRTHTGDRPYRCTEPGCGKAFARPDQLQRHGNVHMKKKAVESAGSGEGIVVK